MIEKSIPRTELRLHTILSDDVSVITPENVILEAVDLGMKAIAITDRNSVQSFHEVDRYWEKYGKALKIIYGAELDGMTVLVKDQQGLKPLYKLISGKEISEEERYHLLFGLRAPAIIQEREWETLRSRAEGYDYIELNIRNDRPRYREQNKLLLELGKELGKPVVAVGNCHYIYPYQRICKDVLDEVKQHCTDRCETHLRTAEEMLKQYTYLGEQAAYEVVVTNPIKIADLIETVRPSAIGTDRFALPDAAQTVRRLCEEKMELLYAQQPQVRQRLEQELAQLGENASMYLLSHEIVKHLRSKGGITGFRGTVGSTLIAWLLDISDINPLPAHHRCQSCKHTEFVPALSGYDLPKKNCPHCGKPMMGDGHNIPLETCMALDGELQVDIDLNMAGDLQPVAKEFVSDLLGAHRVVAAGTVGTYLERTVSAYLQVYEDMTGNTYPVSDKEWILQTMVGVKRCDSSHPGGIMLLPEGKEWEDYTPLRPIKDSVCQFATHMEFHHIMDAVPKLDILGASYYDRLQELFAATGAKPEEVDYQDPKIYALFRNSQTSGLPEFSSTFVRRLMDLQNGLSFSKLSKISGMAHGTDVWLRNGELMARSHPFEDLIGCRDDVFQTLQQYGVDRKTAYAAMTATRKGVLARKTALLEKLQQTDVPQWYLESMKKIRYLFPKAHAAHYTKLACTTAWFKVYYPEAFYTVMMNRWGVDRYVACSNAELEEMRENLDLDDFDAQREFEDICLVLEARERGYLPAP